MQKPDENQMAQMALQFMQRVDLKGGEVEAFVAVQDWLRSKSAPVSIPHPPKEEAS